MNALTFFRRLDNLACECVMQESDYIDSLADSFIVNTINGFYGGSAKFIKFSRKYYSVSKKFESCKKKLKGLAKKI